MKLLLFCNGNNDNRQREVVVESSSSPNKSGKRLQQQGKAHLLSSHLSPVHAIKSMGSGAVVLANNEKEDRDCDAPSENGIIVLHKKSTHSSSAFDTSCSSASSSSCTGDMTTGSTHSGDSFAVVEENYTSISRPQQLLDESFEDPYLKSRDDILSRRRQQLHRIGEQHLPCKSISPPRFPLPQRSALPRATSSPAKGKSLGSFQLDSDFFSDPEDTTYDEPVAAVTIDETIHSSLLRTTIRSISPLRKSISFTDTSSPQSRSSNASSMLPTRLFVPRQQTQLKEIDEISVRSSLTEDSTPLDNTRLAVETERTRRVALRHVALYESTLHEMSLNTDNNNSKLPIKRATLLLQLGAAYEQAQQKPLALQSYSAAASIFRKQQQHVGLATALARTGVTCTSSQQYQRAYNCLQESLRIRLNALGPWHIDTIDTVHSLAVLCWQQGNRANEAMHYEHARAYAWEAVWARQAVFGPDHPSVAVAAYTLAKCYYRLSQWSDARHFLQMALSIYNELGLANEHGSVQGVLRYLRRLERVEMLL